MENRSFYESRPGSVASTPEKIFGFVTDLRNFERFASRGGINGWNANRDDCSFSVPMVGTVNVWLSEKVACSSVVYNGNALSKNDFSLYLDIRGIEDHITEVRIRLTAELNPILRSMAARPISQFLEMLVNEMESFSDWENVKE